MRPRPGVEFIKESDGTVVQIGRPGVRIEEISYEEAIRTSAYESSSYAPVRLQETEETLGSR